MAMANGDQREFPFEFDHAELSISKLSGNIGMSRIKAAHISDMNWHPESIHVKVTLSAFMYCFPLDKELIC